VGANANEKDLLKKEELVMRKKQEQLFFLVTGLSALIFSDMGII